MNKFSKLYEQLEKTNIDEIYTIDSKFYMEFYNISKEKRPDSIIAFMTIFDWFAFSGRSGVWTYYEVANLNDLETTLEFLDNMGEEELRNIFNYGIHDYQNPKYYEDLNYPQVWIDESEKIDLWIFEHEHWLFKWEKNFFLNNKDLICLLLIL